MTFFYYFNQLFFSESLFRLFQTYDEDGYPIEDDNFNENDSRQDYDSEDNDILGDIDDWE